MVFDWENVRQLKSVTKDNVITTYTYNSDGMRTQKSASDGTTKYYYDGNNNLIASWFDNNTSNITVDDVTLYFFYDSDGSPVACQYGSGARYYYVKNLQGDIEKIVNDQGQVLVTYAYDAWGNILDYTDYSTFNLATRNPFRYRSYVYDSETGFYYLQSRYYDPQTGRFLNADVYCDTQTGSPLSTNMFAYCENNSIIFIDPEGFKPKNLEQFIRKRNNIDKTDNVVLGGNKIKLKVTGNKVKIIAAVKFSGGLCDKKVRGLSNFTYQKLFIRGVKDFWSGKFKISFPNYDCKYNIELQTEIIKRNTNANVIKMKNMKGVSNVTYYQKWSFENHGELTMYKGDSRNGGCTYTKDQFKYVAAHEFGHLLGVGDMYNTSVSKDSVFNEFNTRVQNRDVKKVLLAFMKEKFQEWE